MAFTGTALLCGEGSVVEVSKTHNSLLTIAITGALCLLTIIGIVMNNRGSRTLYALLIASTGMAMLMYSVIRDGGQSLYYGGIFIVFMGIWLNGSLFWFLRKMGLMPAQWSKAKTVS
jgi:hypothetical protein